MRQLVISTAAAGAIAFSMIAAALAMAQPVSAHVAAAQPAATSSGSRIQAAAPPATAPETQPGPCTPRCLGRSSCASSSSR